MKLIDRHGQNVYLRLTEGEYEALVAMADTIVLAADHAEGDA